MWTGSATSALGDAVVQIALIFAILHIGGSASDIGVVLAVQTVARVAFLLVGGVWADRLLRQHVMLTADGVRGVVQATLAALLLSEHADIWELAAGGALYGAATSFFNPASTALVPRPCRPSSCSRPTACSGCRRAASTWAGPPSAAC
jgi:MFS family permease